VLRLLIGEDHGHVGESQGGAVPGARHRPEQAGKVDPAVVLGPRRDDVEHAADAAALAGMGEIEPDAVQPWIGFEQALQGAQIEPEPAAGEPRGRAGRHRVHARPSQLEPDHRDGFRLSSGMTCLPNISMDDITFSWGTDSVAMRNCSSSTPASSWMAMLRRQLSGSPATRTPRSVSVSASIWFHRAEAICPDPPDRSTAGAPSAPSVLR